MSSGQTEDARQSAITAVVTKWYKDFEQDQSSEEAKADFVSVYDPEVVWTDHAFHVQRQGHEAVLGLQKSFTYCNQPFTSELKALHVTPTGAVVEMIWVGRCSNDIVRPDGLVVVKAHGKDFRNHICFVLEVSAENKITKIDEYYNKIWEDGVGVEKYHRITGASMKS